MNEAGIAEKFKRADCAARRQKAKRNGDARGQPVKGRMDREVRLVGLDGIFEEHVQHQLVPENGRAICEFRTHDVLERLIVGRERGIGFQGQARLDDAWLWQKCVSFINIDEIGDPQTCGFPQHRVHTVEVEVAPIAFRKFHVSHSFEGHANQEIQVVSVRLEKHLHRRVAGNIVSRERQRRRDRQEREKRCKDTKRGNVARHGPKA